MRGQTTKRFLNVKPSPHFPSGPEVRRSSAVSQDAFRAGADNRVMHILVVDDDPAVRSSLQRALRLEGYSVGLAGNGSEALAAVDADAPDVIVLDLMMPPPDGLEVCRRLRRAGNHTPILMLTAREAVGNRVEGLDAGADDYVVKPFALAELLARLQALLRRPTAGGGASECLRFADLTLRPEGYEAYRGRRRLELTRTEFLLLELFVRNPRQVLA